MVGSLSCQHQPIGWCCTFWGLCCDEANTRYLAAAGDEADVARISPYLGPYGAGFGRFRHLCALYADADTATETPHEQFAWPVACREDAPRVYRLAWRSVARRGRRILIGDDKCERVPAWCLFGKCPVRAAYHLYIYVRRRYMITDTNCEDGADCFIINLP